MKATLLVVLAVIALAAGLAAQSPMRPGLWETTMQMQMPNMPIKMPEMKVNSCVTPEQLKDPASTLPRGPQTGRADQTDCKVSDYKQSGNTVTWKMACTKPQQMTSAGEMTYTNDSYTGTMTMSSAQGAMTMQLSGKRLGDCTK
jgi:hypothetical protein